jgi:predicted RNA-binding protein with PUA-like domain
LKGTRDLGFHANAAGYLAGHAAQAKKTIWRNWCMALWLFKQEPTCYSFTDLQRDKRTVWDGVSNSLALKNLSQVKRNDRVFFYHTGKEKAIVGEMRAVVGAKPAAESGKGVVVEVSFVRALTRPVPLAEIKADKSLAGWDLVRLPRLSVLPVTLEQWRRIEQLSENEC